MKHHCCKTLDVWWFRNRDKSGQKRVCYSTIEHSYVPPPATNAIQVYLSKTNNLGAGWSQNYDCQLLGITNKQLPPFVENIETYWNYHVDISYFDLLKVVGINTETKPSDHSHVHIKKKQFNDPNQHLIDLSCPNSVTLLDNTDGLAWLRWRSHVAVDLWWNEVQLTTSELSSPNAPKPTFVRGVYGK